MGEGGAKGRWGEGVGGGGYGLVRGGKGLEALDWEGGMYLPGKARVINGQCKSLVLLSISVPVGRG